MKNESYLRRSSELKDVNGVEIFEGDILRLCNLDMFVKIEFIRGSFCLVGVGKKLHEFYLKFDFLASIFGYTEDMLEVVGNIHENPEFFVYDNEK